MRTALVAVALLLAPPAAAQTATPTGTPPACPARAFPGHDVIGSVLNKSFVPDEASCAAACCSATGDACLAYSFNAAAVGAASSDGQALPVDVTSVAVADEAGVTDGNGVLFTFGAGAFRTPAVAGCYYAGSFPINGNCSISGNVAAYVNLTSTFAVPMDGMHAPAYSCPPQSSVFANGCSCIWNVYQWQCTDFRGGFPVAAGVTGMYGDEPHRYRLKSSGVAHPGAQRVSSAACVLLSNVTQLVPSNGWNGGIKLSALQAAG
jgi:hypothetical protein